MREIGVQWCELNETHFEKGYKGCPEAHLITLPKTCFKKSLLIWQIIQDPAHNKITYCIGLRLVCFFDYSKSYRGRRRRDEDGARPNVSHIYIYLINIVLNFIL